MFISPASKVDSEALQSYSYKKLSGLLQRVEYILQANEHATFWHQFHDQISQVKHDDEKQALYKVEQQLLHLPEFITTWILTAVDSMPRFEFFVKTKAQEIASGDEQKDYFWAMQIRHDQIVALVRVLEALSEHLEALTQIPVKDAVDHPVIQGLCKYDIEKQVFLEAEKVHTERAEITKSV